MMVMMTYNMKMTIMKGITVTMTTITTTKMAMKRKMVIKRKMENMMEKKMVMMRCHSILLRKGTFPS